MGGPVTRIKPDGSRETYIATVNPYALNATQLQNASRRFSNIEDLAEFFGVTIAEISEAQKRWM